jgi:hypothetical protein
MAKTSCQDQATWVPQTYEAKFTWLMFYKIEFWVKDEMTEKNPIGMPKFLIPM